MIFEWTQVRVTAEHGTATLWLDFPGEPVNALDLNRLRAIDAAIAAVEASPFIDVLVLRSAKPAGFCAGLHPRAVLSLASDADRAALAWVGQQVLGRLESLDATTIAFIDGPCLGAGLELALACDHRLCLCRPTTHLGFPDALAGIVPGFGGSVRLRAKIGRRGTCELLASATTLSGREARALGLVDHAFCERRGKIELRTFLDAIERRGPRVKLLPELAGFAEERRHFTESVGSEPARAAALRQLRGLRPLQLNPPPLNPARPYPGVIGLLGEDEFASSLAATAAMLGHRIVVAGTADRIHAGLVTALTRGFVTPLEAEQARGRVTVADGAGAFAGTGLIIAAAGEAIEDLADALSPTCVVALRDGFAPEDFPHPRRVVGLNATGSGMSLVRLAETDSDALAALASWLKELAPGVMLSVRETAAQAAVRELAAA